MDNTTLTLRHHLFGKNDTRAYAILDGASCPELLEMLDQYKPVSVCLFRGVSDLQMEAVAPYLVQFEPDSPFSDWLLGDWKGKHRGIFVISPTHVPFNTMRNHFRDMTKARLPDGKVVYFRYYDPRVLTVFLPTCNEEELQQIFSCIDVFLAEETDGLVGYSLTGGKLEVRRTPF
jgi:hypothetical protein